MLLTTCDKFSCAHVICESCPESNWYLKGMSESVYSAFLNLGGYSQKALCFLFMNKNSLCKYRDMIKFLWEDENRNSSSLKVVICQVRKFLELTGYRIKNIRGQGYCLIEKYRLLRSDC